MKHLHILGICGTFMGGLARIATELGFRVSGSDANTYPPMSTQLEQLGVQLYDTYAVGNFDDHPDLVLVGNALSRGNCMVEAMLDRGLHYCSGPQWLAETVLVDKWVLAVAGTHGKTTTASILAWILADCGYDPGFLLGGVAANFEHSARTSTSPFFVIEADEYDSAFFDKRSKMLHYRPKTFVINNLEFDHADIFDSLADIQRQFHHTLRTVPHLGQIIYPAADDAIKAVLAMGCWSERHALGGTTGWRWELEQADGSVFRLIRNEADQQAEVFTRVHWSMLGEHNVANAVAAMAAAHHVGVVAEEAAASLAKFRGVKRRLEQVAELNGIHIFDDFAHHPTAIAATLAALRARIGSARLVAVVDPGSNTMKNGGHRATLLPALSQADCRFIHFPDSFDWQLEGAQAYSGHLCCAPDPANLLRQLLAELRRGDYIVMMSNGGFGGFREHLLAALSRLEKTPGSGTAGTAGMGAAT